MSDPNAPAKLTSSFDQIGGSKAFGRIAERFHERIEEDPLLRSLFPKNMHSLNESFALFLGERMGGPPEYTARRGKQSLICRHAHLSISTGERDRWLNHVFAAIDEVGVGEPARTLLRQYLEETADSLTDPFIPLYHLPLDQLRARIASAPELLQPSPMGHSLLREAVQRWDALRVRILLEAGADANSEEPLGHGPLYRAANASFPGEESEGREVAELLLRYGADVNKPSGPGKSTPLHMTARRGHVFLADVLLAAGADIEAADSKGETPLRRAVNCAQESMVTFLLSGGASPLTRDKRGQTPLDTARNVRIRLALEQSIGRR